MIPEAAIEAATAAQYKSERGRDEWVPLEQMPSEFLERYRATALLVLEAAAPHMLVPTRPKPGEGDYLPGWDDRKTLAELWQHHAPLPECGLRGGTYDALIAIATWGYQQRKDEEL